MRTLSLLQALAASLFVAFLAAPMAARAEVQLSVDQGVVQPLPIAIPAFSGLPVGGQIVQVIDGNLAGSGLFRILAASSFTDRDLSIGVQPRFDTWKAIQAQVLV